jgi:hypothetical protein
MSREQLTRADLQLFIRCNGTAWPGGYPLVLWMKDGECVDAQTARENYRQIRRNMVPNEPIDNEWAPFDVEIHWEGDPIICAHSGRLIESAYGNPWLEV